MEVYVLVILMIKEPTFGTIDITINRGAFRTAARCLEVANRTKMDHHDQYDRIEADCHKQKLEK